MSDKKTDLSNKETKSTKTTKESETRSSSQGSDKSRTNAKNSLLNIFNNRNTKELNNLKQEAKIMDIRSNLSNNELECKYKLFCLTEQQANSGESAAELANSLNEVLNTKIKLIKLANKLHRDIRCMKSLNRRAEKNLKDLYEILTDLF